MKKKIFGFVLGVLALCVSAMAFADFSWDDSTGPFIGRNGGVLNSQSAISGPNSPGAPFCTSSFIAIPMINVVVGMPLVYVNAVTYTASTADVSGTATANDVNFAGYALNSAFVSSTTCPTFVRVCTSGVINEISLVSTTVGERMALTTTNGTVAFNNTPGGGTYFKPGGTTPCQYGNVTATTYDELTGTAGAATYTAQTVGAYVGRAMQNVTAVGTPIAVPVQFP